MRLPKFLHVLLIATFGTLISAGIGVGCWSAPRTISLDQLGPITTLQTYAGSNPAAEQTIAADSQEAAAVREWLRAHPSGWRPSLVTYVPVNQVIGPDLNLNVTGRQCVLNYRQPNGEWTQLVRPLADGEEFPDVFNGK